MCPCCDKNHTHDPGTGHHPAQCAEEDRCKGIVIGDRSFIPAYGYTILEYMSEGNVKLIQLPSAVWSQPARRFDRVDRCARARVRIRAQCLLLYVDSIFLAVSLRTYSTTKAKTVKAAAPNKPPHHHEQHFRHPEAWD